MNIKPTFRLALPLVAAALAAAGCSGGDETPPGYEKEAFKKTGPPAEYKGPGQPGGPQSGPIGGPPGGTTGG